MLISAVIVLWKLRHQNFHMQLCGCSKALSRCVCCHCIYQGCWPSFLAPMRTGCHMYSSACSLVFICFLSFSHAHHAMQYVPMSLMTHTAKQPSFSCVKVICVIMLYFYLRVKKMSFFISNWVESLLQNIFFMQLMSLQIMPVQSVLPLKFFLS